MQNTTTTPPNTEYRKVIFNFDLKKFTKTISRLTEDLLSDVKISVWAPGLNGSGKCVNILASKLSEREFDELAEKAMYTIYEGSNKALQDLGVA